MTDSPAESARCAFKHTGTSWEDYFRDVEGNPTRTVDSINFRTGVLLFRAGGPWATGFDGNVDAFAIGTGGTITVYDFESRQSGTSIPERRRAERQLPLLRRHRTPALENERQKLNRERQTSARKSAFLI
ncbi:MAG TPA: hypothetical protein VNA19_00485 [Pyrinomonadaceae bacterium]|nr:hypothetical protein [Pyrinomonadaceae bacterium]